MSGKDAQPAFHSMPPENLSSDSAQSKGVHLRGQTVLVTRSAEQAGSFRERLERLGARVVVHPAIEIKPPADFAKLDASLANLKRTDSYQWVVFVSGNGVTHFFDRFQQQGLTLELFQNLNVVAIGAATLAQLETIGIKKVRTPTVSNSESLAELIIDQAAQRRVLIIRADRGSEELANRLEGAKIDFEEVVAYRSTDVKSADPAVLKMISEGKIDWVTMTSSAIASSSIRLFGDAITNSGGKVKTVSISPRTSQAMRDLGFEPDAEAVEINMAGIVAAMQNFD